MLNTWEFHSESNKVFPSYPVHTVYVFTLYGKRRRKTCKEHCKIDILLIKNILNIDELIYYFIRVKKTKTNTRLL